jgi:hypothetical protein
LMDFWRPTNKGITMCGNTTTSRNGKRGWTWGWGLLDMVLTFQSKIQLIWG